MQDCGQSSTASISSLPSCFIQLYVLWGLPYSRKVKHSKVQFEVLERTRTWLQLEDTTT